MSKFFKQIWQRTPWLTVLLVVVWLIVLGVISQRYLNRPHNLVNNDLKVTNSLESGVSAISSGDLLQEQLNLNAATHDVAVVDKYLFESTTTSVKPINLLSDTLYSVLGELHAIYDVSSMQFMLFLNQTPIMQVHTSIVDYAFQLSGQHVILVFAAEIVGRDYVYTILDLSADGHRVMHEVGNYEQLIGVGLNSKKSCILLRFADARKYTERDDYQVYQYCGIGNVAKVLDVKSESYYQSKFAKLSAMDIYQIAHKDGCMNSMSNSFILNRSCSYGIKYCHMFKSMLNPKHDKYYLALQQACQQRSAAFEQREYLSN